MKIKVKAVSITLLMVILLFCSAIQMFGQKKVNISAGIGFPQALNVGIRYQLNQSQIGLSIGTWPSSDKVVLGFFDWESLVSLSGDYYYHFGGKSKFSDLPPWYGKVGLDYLRIGWVSNSESNLESHLRIGRDFYLMKDFGFGLDAGVGVFILNETGFTTVLPSLGIWLFYSF